MFKVISRAPRMMTGLAAAIVVSCAPLIDETGLACPCASGYVCCESTNTCLAPGAACTGAAPDASPGSTPEDGGSTPDATAPTCGALPTPKVHFDFADCDARGSYVDRASGLVGLAVGGGV